MKTKSLLVVLLLACMLFFPTQKVQADECTTVWVPDPPQNGSFKTVCSGGSSGGGDNPPSSGCTPGTTIMVSEYVPYPLDPAICRLVVTQIDICTGEILWVGVDYDQDILFNTL